MLFLDDATEHRVLTQTLLTTLTRGDQWQRTKLKAVGDGYPLQGNLITAENQLSEGIDTFADPGEGEIWLDSRLIVSLNAAPGDILLLAEQSFTVTRILLHEPDRLMEGHTVDMRAMINISDMQKLNFAQDLVEHRYLFTADTAQVERILAWQKEYLPAAQVHHKTGSHPLALFWQRTENFLGLTSIILFFMAAIAIEKLTHVQMGKEQYFSAVCMSLGASKTTGIQISLFKWLINLLLLLPPVLALSALSHWLLIDWLKVTFNDINWQWDMALGLTSLLSLAAIFLIFQTPVWIALQKSSVAQLVNNHQQKVSHWITVACALAVMTLIAVYYSDNGLLTAMVLSSMLICIFLIALVSWGSLTLMEKATKNVSGLFPFAMFMMKQRLLNKSTQILGVGLCSFLLLFTLMLMKDLVASLSAYERKHNGNLLVSQASATQMQDIVEWASRHSAEILQQKPFMYARLIKVNDQHLSDYSDKPNESVSTMARSIRLHWADSLPANNTLVSGQWWQTNDVNWQQVSIEEEVMTDLGLAIGDTLTFFIHERAIDFNIAASHVYRAGEGSITFWVQMPPSSLSHINAPQYSMASLELGDEQFAFLKELWQTHPLLRMVSLNEMTARFDDTLAMVTRVISGFSALIILLSIIVILATIHAVEGNERKKNSVIMSFGFSKRTCLRLNVIEWLVTGAVAATGAIAGTYIAGFSIYQNQFSLPYRPDFLWLLGTLFSILLAVTTVGVLASKKSLNNSIRELMTE